MTDFLMTYPCFVPVLPNGCPDCITTEDGRAVCLFTDLDLAERYCATKRKAIRERGGPDVQFKLAGYCSAESLLKSLSDAAATLAEQGVRLVAIDATPGKPTCLMRLDDFLGLLGDDAMPDEAFDDAVAEQLLAMAERIDMLTEAVRALTDQQHELVGTMRMLCDALEAEEDEFGLFDGDDDAEGRL